MEGRTNQREVAQRSAGRKRPREAALSSRRRSSARSDGLLASDSETDEGKEE
jgi:hypothetical protein